MSEFVCEVAPDEFGELTEVANLGEEIVRCRDCKFMQDKNVCAKHSFFSAGYFYFVKPDDYCAWGEKRCDGSTSCS